MKKRSVPAGEHTLQKERGGSYHIFPISSSGRRYQVGAIVVIHLSLLYLVRRGSKEKEGIRLFRNIEDDGLIFLGILEEEGGGCLRPDDEIRFILCDLQRKSSIDLQCFPLKRFVPLDRLIDIPLNQTDFQ